jgi:hypothetical protein
MTIATAAFARNRADDIFFPGTALALLVTIVTAFGHAYFFAGMMAAPLPSTLVHVHAFVLTAWVALQALQPILVAAGRTAWHQTAGLAGMAFAVAVPTMGILAVIGEVRRHAEDAGGLTLDLAFGFAAVIAFAVLVFLGLRQRNRDLSAHKRFMLIATISILGPAIGRLPFVSGAAAPYYASFAFFAAAVIAFDLLSLGRIHRATMAGLGVIVATQGLAELFWPTDAAHDLVTWIQNV